MATITICDKCGAQGAKRVFVWDGGFQPDPAGGHSEETGEHKDICEPCEAKILKTMVAKLDAARHELSIPRRLAQETCMALGVTWKGSR